MPKGQAAFIAALLLAVAFVGGTPGPLGIHADCLDDIDNDQDYDLNGDGMLQFDELTAADPRAGFDIDGAYVTLPPLDTDKADYDCLEYPFEDGNGESPTPMEMRFQSEYGYEMSAFDFFMSRYDPVGFEDKTNQDPCDPMIMWPPEDGSADAAASYCNPP